MSMIRESFNHKNYVTIGLLMALIGLLLIMYMCASQIHLTKQYQQPNFRVEVIR